MTSEEGRESESVVDTPRVSLAQTPVWLGFLPLGGAVEAACGEGDAEVSQRFPDGAGPIHSWGGEVRTPFGEGAAEAPRCGRAHTLMGRRGLHALMHRLYNTSRHH